MKGRVLGVALLLTSVAAHGMGWSDLWLRPDQQTLEQRRLAYEEIQTQRYPEAAKRLQPYTDPESQYNRGNALARAGDLKEALSAYDAALKGAPQDSALQRDARHNRELVERQMKTGEEEGQREQQAGKDGQQSGNPSQQAGNSGPPPPPQDSGETPSPGQADKQAQGQQPQGKAPPDNAQPDDAQQGDARQDRAASAAAQVQAAREGQAQRQVAPDSLQSQGAEQPQSEQALSLDQWLRWIPDDPSGLLRRKFMIEHMLKQRETRP